MTLEVKLAQGHGPSVLPAVPPLGATQNPPRDSWWFKFSYCFLSSGASD